MAGYIDLSEPPFPIGKCMSVIQDVVPQASKFLWAQPQKKKKETNKQTNKNRFVTRKIQNS